MSRHKGTLTPKRHRKGTYNSNNLQTKSGKSSGVLNDFHFLCLCSNTPTSVATNYTNYTKASRCGRIRVIRVICSL